MIRDLISRHAQLVLAFGGLLIGFVFGSVVYRTNYCAMGSLSDIHNFKDYRRLRAWILAAATALVGTKLLHAAGVVAIEQSGSYRGCYFVLMGHLSPLDGVGPAEIGIDAFERLLGEGEVREVILATNPTVEGEATAHFLGEVITRRGIRASRIAHGVPVGGELEYVDGGTLAHALAGRQALS